MENSVEKNLFTSSLEIRFALLSYKFLILRQKKRPSNQLDLNTKP